MFFCHLIWCYFFIKLKHLSPSVSECTGLGAKECCNDDYFIRQEKSCLYLGRPSHMTQDGDQLASYSFSLKVLGCSSVAGVASSTTWTSSALRATAGDAALAFSIATASLWLKLVKSMPLIFNKMSPVPMTRHEKWAEGSSDYFPVILFVN